jgi:hypothetical protein
MGIDTSLKKMATFLELFFVILHNYYYSTYWLSGPHCSTSILRADDGEESYIKMLAQSHSRPTT